jgi:hypothetical protein
VVFEAKKDALAPGVIAALEQSVDRPFPRLGLRGPFCGAGKDANVWRAHESGIIDPSIDQGDFLLPFFGVCGGERVADRRAADGDDLMAMPRRKAWRLSRRRNSSVTFLGK